MPLFWKLLCGVWVAGVIVAAFLGVGPAVGFRAPEAARILFFHVPTAWLAVLGFVLSMLHGIHYLHRRQLEHDRCSAVAAELGFLFCLLATVTGAIFAHVQWGAAWNWDPRETSIVALLLIYGAYFALRSAIDDEERRAALSASYAILAVLPMLFLIFVLPRVVDSLHPSDTVQSGGMSPSYRLVFFAALFGFTLLFVWIYRLRVGVERLALRREG
jgi:heme exporter protein C